MSTLNRGMLLAKEILARCKGDNAEATANKIARKACSAVDSQLAALKAKQVDSEDAVEEATEKLAAAKYPTEMITDAKNYIQGIQNAEANLSTAKDNLADVNTSIAYFETLSASF